jgi:hypothetical protein
MTYALREARRQAAHALAALIARIIALMALAALGLSGDRIHEPVHAEAPASRHPATVRNVTKGAVSAPVSGPGGHGADGLQTAAISGLACGYAADCSTSPRIGRTSARRNGGQPEDRGCPAQPAVTPPRLRVPGLARRQEPEKESLMVHSRSAASGCAFAHKHNQSRCPFTGRV